MTVVEMLLARRSEHKLEDPAPDDDLLLQLLEVAATAADHGRLRPWRMIAHRGDGRLSLGSALAADVFEKHRDQLIAKAMRAPLILTVIFTPRSSERIPAWEQLIAASGVVHLLILLLHEVGFGSIWRTGAAASCAAQNMR